MITSLSSTMFLEADSFKSSKNLSSNSFAFLPRSLSSWASIADKNFCRNLGIWWVTLTDGEECNWLIHSSKTMGASFSLHYSNLVHTELMNESRSNCILELRHPSTVSLILSSTFLANSLTSAFEPAIN